MKQEFDWGYVQWLCQLEGSVNVGISHIKGKTEQLLHSHYGNEQYIYVLSGQGEYEVNGESFYLKEGMGIYFPPNATHRTKNTEEDELVDLCISVPHKSFITPWNTRSSILKEGIGKLQEEISWDYFNFPMGIFDPRGHLVYGNYLYQSQVEGVIDQSSFRKKEQERNVEKVICNNICFYSLRIGRDSFQGDVRVGYFEKKHNHEQDQIYKASIDSMVEILKDVVEGLHSYFSIQKMQGEINEILGECHVQGEELQRIRHDLFQKEENILDVKLYREFLKQGLYLLTYEASKINLDLYEMLVYFERFVTGWFKKEQETIGMQKKFLEEYLKFQQKKYQKDFSYYFKIDPKLESYSLPKHLLMPLVKNAFDYGFNGYEGTKIIEIRIFIEESDLIVEVLNNGKILDLNSLKRLNDSLKNSSISSITLIDYKLNKKYKKYRYRYEMESNFLKAKIVIGDYFE